jgi:hypothetical protein
MIMEVKFEKGDWCFCEFKLQQILEVDGDKVREVSDGSFRLSSSDLSDRCYPLDLKVKRISDSVSYYRDKLHEIKSLNLNYPDLNRELIGRWCEMCNVRNDDKMLQKKYDELAERRTLLLNNNIEQ